MPQCAINEPNKEWCRRDVETTIDENKTQKKICLGTLAKENLLPLTAKRRYKEDIKIERNPNTRLKSTLTESNLISGDYIIIYR